MGAIRGHWLVLAAALLPAAVLAWHWRTMPYLGLYHDDAMYFATAKAVAEGGGYMMPSLPVEAAQTKYPPVWPMLLSVVWRVAPEFPANLVWAMGLIWALYAAAMVALWRLLEGETRLWVTVLSATLPAMVWAGVVLMSEIPFLLAVFVALGLAERASDNDSVKGIALAGLAGGLAYLTRTAALPLFIGVALALTLRRQWRLGAVFCAAMLPFMAGWHVWTAMQNQPGDAVLVWYTSYAGYHRADVAVSRYPAMMAVNFGMFLTEASRYVVLPGDFWPLRMLVSGVAIGGVVRLVGQGKLVMYGAFGLVYSLLLLMHNYAPNPRFLLPVAPLMVAGFLSFAGAVRLRTAWAGVLMLCVNVWGVAARVHPSLGADAERLQAARPAMEWIKTNTEADARVLSYIDPVVWLHTGRRGASMRPYNHMVSYARDEKAVRRFFAEAPEIARRLGIEYALRTPQDYMLDAPEVTGPPWTGVLRGEDFEMRYEEAGGGVYQLKRR
ncbi:MAG: hypothetical protein FJW20_17265 [Acidimicrobiia bacterium]|nr:hypothetical protein [Acidimicrobiia bacterium]